MRYTDPDVGPRMMPVLNEYTTGKTVISESCKFNVNLETKTITLQENGAKVTIGSQIVYVIE